MDELCDEIEYQCDYLCRLIQKKLSCEQCPLTTYDEDGGERCALDALREVLHDCE